MLKEFRFSLIAAVLVSAAWMPLRSQELGSITFPTSGAPAAQAEFYGELLLDAGRAAEAAAALELSLQRTPYRTASVKALARARATGTALR